MAPVKPKYQTIAGRCDTDTHDDNDQDAAAEEAVQPIEVIVLDFTHSRFTVPLTAGLAATVADLKTSGALHHNVPAPQQRLIYQGKLLSDDQASMRQCNIHHGSIVHLFPKPRVVVTNGNNNGPEAASASASSSSSQQPPSNGGAGGGGESGGRVPTIVLNEAEHARRGQILVLGSVDYMEAVNNVKLFSFMLLIISTIELLNLIAVALGEGTVDGENGLAGPHNDAMPYVEHDDFFPSDDDATGTSSPGDASSSNAAFGNGTTEANDNNSNGTDLTTGGFANPYQTWTPLSWLDLVVSVLGIYVALLGIRASNDNVLSIARLYLIGTAITAVGWLVYNFIINFEIDEMVRDNNAQQQAGSGGHNNNDPGHPSSIAPLNGNTVGANGDSVFNQAVQAMVLPAVVWGLCIFRAWQFQHLLAEAELEAMERIQNEQEGGGGEPGGGGGDDEEQALQLQFNGQPSSSSTPAPLPAIS